MSKEFAYGKKNKRFSSEWWIDNLRTFFWVLLVTVLVWIYADIEFTDKMELQPRIQLNTGSNNDLALMSGTEQQIIVSLSGSQSQLEQFRRKLREQGWTINYDVSERHGPGKYKIATADILAASTSLRQDGISVESVEPQEIEFELDEYISRKMPVKLLDPKKELTKIEIQPPVVSVRAQSRIWEKIDKLEESKRVILVEEIDLTSLTPGREETLTGKLRNLVNNNIPVRTNPDRVQVTLQLESNREVRTVRATVQVQSPPQWYEAGKTWEKYRLERSPTSEWVVDVRLVGSKTDLDILQANLSEKMDAYIVLGDRDRNPVDSFISREVQFRFSDELDVELAPGQKIAVDFRLVRIASP